MKKKVLDHDSTSLDMLGADRESKRLYGLPVVLGAWGFVEADLGL